MENPTTHPEYTSAAPLPDRLRLAWACLLGRPVMHRIIVTEQGAGPAANGAVIKRCMF